MLLNRINHPLSIQYITRKTATTDICVSFVLSLLHIVEQEEKICLL